MRERSNRYEGLRLGSEFPAAALDLLLRHAQLRFWTRSRRDCNNPVILRAIFSIRGAARAPLDALLGTCAERLIIPCVCYALYT